MRHKSLKIIYGLSQRRNINDGYHAAKLRNEAIKAHDLIIIMGYMRIDMMHDDLAEFKINPPCARPL